MTVRTVIVIILSIYAYILTLKHNMHMLQLNGYKNDEHINWLKKNLRQQWLLYFGFVIGILRMLFVSVFLDILICLTLIMIILVYRAIGRLNTKKKLVYTGRVKRMIATISLISAVIIVTAAIIGGIRPVSGMAVIVVSLQCVLNLLSNLINHPIEAGINRHYINDAKRMLKNRPDLKIIGVTGSFGKTSVKIYLQTLLQSKYNVLITPGNFNTTLGVVRTIREHLKPVHEIFICEMGARRVGDIKEICDLVHPDHGIITSVGPQHLETFHSLDNVTRTKFELADGIASGGMLFLNGDNEYIRAKASDYSNVIFYNSADTGAGYYAKDIKVSQFGTEFTAVTPDGESERFTIRLIGSHNVINVMGAIAVAHSFGIPLKDLKVPARRLAPVEHRMQLREQGNVTIIDDAYNSNPIGSKAAVETLKMFDGVRILITPGMVELGEKEDEYNYAFGTYAADCCDHILLVGKKRTQPILNGVLSKGFDENRCKVFDRLEDALHFAYSIKDNGHKYILLENDLPDNY